MSDIKQDIRTFIVETFLFGQDSNLTNETSFLEQGIVDSTGVLELVAHLEKTYDLKVKDEELIPDNLDSINAISDFLAKKRPLIHATPTRYDNSPPSVFRPWAQPFSLPVATLRWFGIFSNTVPTGSLARPLWCAMAND